MIRRTLVLFLVAMLSASALPLYAQEPVPPQTTNEKKAVVTKAIAKHHTVVVKFIGEKKKIEGTVSSAAAKVGIGVGIGFAVLATAAAIALRGD